MYLMYLNVKFVIAARRYDFFIYTQNLIGNITLSRVIISVTLRRIDKAKGTKELWTAIDNLTGAQGSEGIRHNITAEDLNSRFAATSTDPQYLPPPLKQTAAPALHAINEQQLFGILDRLRPTAEGSDLIPAWFLRVLAPICSAWLARLFNIYLCSSWVPLECKNVIIHPLPKVRPSLSASDFRPIS